MGRRRPIENREQAEKLALECFNNYLRQMVSAYNLSAYRLVQVWKEYITEAYECNPLNTKTWHEIWTFPALEWERQESGHSVEADRPRNLARLYLLRMLGKLDSDWTRRQTGQYNYEDQAVIEPQQLGALMAINDGPDVLDVLEKAIDDPSHEWSNVDDDGKYIDDPFWDSYDSEGYEDV